MKALWVPLGLIALLTPALASADYFRYETDEGVVSFTDDLKQIPSRYKDAAEPISEQSLVNYRRVTIVPRGASNTAAPTNFERSSLNTSTEPTRDLTADMRCLQGAAKSKDVMFVVFHQQESKRCGGLR